MTRIVDPAGALTLFVTSVFFTRPPAGPIFPFMILRTEKLTKVFDVGLRKVAAVESLDLEVAEGEIFGFVGPNGAGKTTTIKMLMGLIFPTRGKAWIFDALIPSSAAKARLGYLPENPAYYDFLTGIEAMRFYATLAGVAGGQRDRRCEELLGLVGLANAAGRQIRKYSKGMQQRLGVAQALLSEPALVVLDEPMSGLDPIGRKEVRDLILELRRRGTTVFFSTHILPDVETLCDRVGMIAGGRLRAVGKLGDLLSARVRSVEVAAVASGAAAGALASGRVLARDGDRITVSFEAQEQSDAAVRSLLDAGGRLVSVTPHRESLEDFFMRHLGDREATPPAAAGGA
jgi:ABC-2 type transport system ATP-binding protein